MYEINTKKYMFEDLHNVKKTLGVALNTKYALMAMAWKKKFTLNLFL